MARDYSNILPDGYQINWNNFGNRWTGNNVRLHNGNDLAAPRYSPILSPADGTVIEVGSNTDGRGYFISVLHVLPNGRMVITDNYHLNEKPSFQVGDYVLAGEQIGQVGNTGFYIGQNGGYHLHYQERVVIDVNKDGTVNYATIGNSKPSTNADYSISVDPEHDINNLSRGGAPNSETWKHIEGNGYEYWIDPVSQQKILCNRLAPPLNISPKVMHNLKPTRATSPGI